MCLDPDATVCDEEYLVLGVYDTSALSNVRASGLVGMAPTNSDSGAPLFMDEMYNSGAIDERVFSLFITDYFDLT